MNVTLGVLPAISTNPLTNVSVNKSAVKTVPLPSQSTATATTKKPVDLDRVQQGLDIFQDLFSTFKPNASSAPSTQPQASAPQKQGLSTVAKVGIASGAVLLTYAVIKAFGKKKSKSLAGVSAAKPAKKVKSLKPRKAAKNKKKQSVESVKI
jgi:hypothetical protein